MAAFQFYLQSGKQRKVRWMGEDNHVVRGKKFPSEKKCEKCARRDATANSFVAKVRLEVFAHFQAVAVKRHCSIQNWLFCLPGRILCKHTANDEIALDFALHLSRLFGSRCNWTCHSDTRVRLILSSLNACLNIVRVSVALLPRFS
jgi:hypothetical protein